MIRLEPKVFYIENPVIGNIYTKDKKQYLCVGLYEPFVRTDIEQLNILLQGIIDNKNVLFVSVLTGYMTKINFRSYIKKLTFTYLLYCTDTDKFYLTTMDKKSEELVLFWEQKLENVLKEYQKSDVILSFKETVNKVDTIADEYYEKICTFKIKGKKNTILTVVETYFKDKAMQRVEEKLNNGFYLKKDKDKYFFTKDNTNSVLSNKSSVKEKEYYSVRYLAYYLKEQIREFKI